MKSVQNPNKFVVKETILVILNNYLFTVDEVSTNTMVGSEDEGHTKAS